MKKNNQFLEIITVLGIFLGANFAAVSDVRAEVILPKASPIAKISQRIGLSDITIDYSSPGVKGRKVFGDVVKLGEVWRTGANMCTALTLSTPALIAGKDVPAGKYCLFTIPTKDIWTFIISSDSKQFGAFTYDQNKDVLRTEIKMIKAPFTERMAFTITDFDDKKGKINLNWDTVMLSIPFEFKTSEYVNKNIDVLNDDSSESDYADAARYVFTDLGDLNRANILIDKSIGVKPT